jgi:hypothetical protein
VDQLLCVLRSRTRDGVKRLQTMGLLESEVPPEFAWIEPRDVQPEPAGFRTYFVATCLSRAQDECARAFSELF